MKKSSLLSAFKSNFYMIGLTFKACPSAVIAEYTRRLCQSIFQVFSTVVFWEVVLKHIEKGASFQSIIPFLIIFTVVAILSYGITSFCNNVVLPIGNQKIYENMHLMMFKKATDVELECYENKEFYDKYMKAVKQIKSRAHTVQWVVSRFIISLVIMAYYLYKTIQIDPFVIVFCVAPIAINYILGKKLNQIKYQLYQENVTAERQKEYVKRSVYQQDYAKELRMSNGYQVLMNYFRDAVEVVMENTKKYGLKAGIVSGLSQGLTQLFIFAGSILYVSFRLIYLKNIEISDFIILINIIVEMFNKLNDDAYLINRITDNYLYIENIREFLNYEPKISENQPGKPVDSKELNIEMKNMSFAYFGQTEPVLKDINFSIKNKEKIVLVGENGAGKTTLVKLLMRLYDPISGGISLNGTDVREYAVKEYRSLFGTVFQDFRILGLTVAENVLMDEVAEGDLEHVKEALEDSGVYDKVKTLPNDINTILTKEFDEDGAVLSGGENQKIAIARVFAKDCRIAVFDEPSSALDPIAEYQMYESMLKACENKAVVFISHRLSSAVLADRIYMLEKGRIIETGSHEELMKLNGKYAKMFRFQAQNYT